MRTLADTPQARPSSRIEHAQRRRRHGNSAPLDGGPAASEHARRRERASGNSAPFDGCPAASERAQRRERASGNSAPIDRAGAGRGPSARTGRARPRHRRHGNSAPFDRAGAASASAHTPTTRSRADEEEERNSALINSLAPIRSFHRKFIRTFRWTIGVEVIHTMSVGVGRWVSDRRSGTRRVVAAARRMRRRLGARDNRGGAGPCSSGSSVRTGVVAGRGRVRGASAGPGGVACRIGGVRRCGAIGRCT